MLAHTYPAPQPCPPDALASTLAPRKEQPLNDQNTPATEPEAPAPLTADTRGSDFEIQSYDIDPADQALADEIASFDPVLSTRGPTEIGRGVKLPATMKATGLSPHLRDPILAQLANVPVDRRDAEEQRLVYEALYQNGLQVRTVCGPGEGANAYEREFFALEFDRHEAAREIDRLGQLLGEVNGTAEIITDGDGQQRVLTIHRVQGQRRIEMEAEWRRAIHRLAQLNGLEAERRMKKAHYEAVQEVKAQRAQVEERREGVALGDQMAREERVKRIAEARAKGKRNAL